MITEMKLHMQSIEEHRQAIFDLTTLKDRASRELDRRHDHPGGLEQFPDLDNHGLKTLIVGCDHRIRQQQSIIGSHTDIILGKNPNRFLNQEDRDAN